MRGIQINNFFNNNISLNGKKINNHHPADIYQASKPKPMLIDHIPEKKDQEEKIILTESRSPQMKVQQKRYNQSSKQQRANNINLEDKKIVRNAHKQKLSSSMERVRRGVSADKQISKQSNDQRSLKINASKNKHSHHLQKSSPDKIKRSKSVIIKSKHLQTKDISKQFLKYTKKVASGAEDSRVNKSSSKKLIKKQTQLLIDQKNRTQNRVSRVPSTMIKSKKATQKLTNDLILQKFQTQKKSARTTQAKSYLTSAKQSKPMSARQTKIKKKLFSKQKHNENYLDKTDLKLKLDNLINQKDEIQNYQTQVNEAMTQLQSALQYIQSKRSLAKQLKKFTNKLKKTISYNNSQQNSQQDNSNNNQALHKIKNLHKKITGKHQKQRIRSSQKDESKKQSSKKLLKDKKKLKNPTPQSGLKKQITKLQNMNIQKLHNMKIELNKSQQRYQPSPFRHQESDQSKFIDSKEEEEYKHQITNNELSNQQRNQSDESESEQLDSSNKKYMQFLLNLQAQHEQREEREEHEGLEEHERIEEHEGLDQFKNQQIKNQQIKNQQIKKKQIKNQQIKNQQIKNQQIKNQQIKNQQIIQNNSIQDINTYLNGQNLKIDNRLYQSEKLDQLNQKIFTNPMLERRRNQFDNLNYQDEKINQNNQSDNQIQLLKDQEQDRILEILKLKQFRKQSDKMMQKISFSKGKNLTIEVNDKKSIDTGYHIKNENIPRQPSEFNKKSLLKSPKYNQSYPNQLKSPRLNELQIKNILQMKQKFLSSKHQKMNELIQKMFQKQLVSPKSYQYSIFQQKIKFQQETNGLDQFKEQASQILRQINKDKDQIKGIQQLMRQEKWDEAKKLIRSDPSQIKAFCKKNRQKVYQQYQGWEKVEIKKKIQTKKNQPQNQDKVNISPLRVKKIQVIQRNINISIQPTEPIEPKKQQVKLIISQQVNRKQSELKQNYNFTQERYSDSQSQQNNQLQKSTGFDFESKYRLRGIQDDKQSDSYDIKRLTEQANEYLNVDKNQLQDHQHYIYYQSEQSEMNDNHSGVSSAHTQNQLREEGMFKLIEIQNSDQNNTNSIQDAFEQNPYLNGQNIQIITNSNKKSQNVYHIDDQQSDLKQPQLEQTSKLNNNSDSIERIVEIDDDMKSQSSSLIELQLRKGFQSNLFFIKQYCISLCEFIRDSWPMKEQFKKRIRDPIQFNELKLLKSYRYQPNGQYDAGYNSLRKSLAYTNQIRKSLLKGISSELADSFNRSYTQLKFYNLDTTDKSKAKFKQDQQYEKVFLTAVLQVLNESLDFERPGSIFGKPLPWSSSEKALKNMKYLVQDKMRKPKYSQGEESAESYDFIFGVAIARIIQWGSCLCGFLPDTAELENTQIDEDYVLHIRQTRMAYLLQKMLAEQQATINNSELEQAEVMLCLGKIISNELIQEAQSQIKKLAAGNISESE